MVLFLFLCDDLSLKLLDTLLFLCLLACDLETVTDELSKSSSNPPSFVERLGYLGDDVVKVMLFNTQMVVFSNFHCVHPLFVSEQVSCTVGIVWNEHPTSDKASKFLSIGGTW